MQCPKDGCDGEEAAFFQVQIRSADEPMTGFYKVRCFLLWGEGWTGPYPGMDGGIAILANVGIVVYDLWDEMERELGELEIWKGGRRSIGGI